jgi:TPR repeat protein
MMTAPQLAAALSGGDAASWVEAAAACGIAEAQVRLGRMLLEGRGIPKDERAAFACFLASLPDRDAENMVGRCYENGWGTARDMARAEEHFRASADAGLDWAQYNLGHLLLDSGRRDEAFMRYMSAAAQGHVRAMNLVARCFEEGWGRPRDVAAARVWYRRSAEGGYFRGAYNYASLLAAEGRGDEARALLENALGDAPAETRVHIFKALDALMSAR